jgi:hypothetical protein
VGNRVLRTNYEYMLWLTAISRAPNTRTFNFSHVVLPSNSQAAGCALSNHQFQVYKSWRGSIIFHDNTIVDLVGFGCFSGAHAALCGGQSANDVAQPRAFRGLKYQTSPTPF